MVDSNGKVISNRCNLMVFAGRLGVGITNCAATTAFHHASMGGEILEISADAAPSLAHTFALDGGERLIKVQKSLCINEVGREEVKVIWDEKLGREVHGGFSSLVSVDYDDFVVFRTSLLPGLGDIFMVDYIRVLSRKGKYNTMIWDTAPLGQTLTLLQTPTILRRHCKMAAYLFQTIAWSYKSGADTGYHKAVGESIY